MPFEAKSRRTYAPSTPSIARSACVADVNAYPTLVICETGTTEA